MLISHCSTNDASLTYSSHFINPASVLFFAIIFVSRYFAVPYILNVRFHLSSYTRISVFWLL